MCNENDKLTPDEFASDTAYKLNGIGLRYLRQLRENNFDTDEPKMAELYSLLKQMRDLGKVKV